MRRPGVTAIIPCWNGAALLKTLLDSLASQTLPFDDIIVVDNGSSEDLAELAKQAGARWLRFESNRGFAWAVNRGIEASQTEWLAILNNDVTLAADWLATLLADLQANDARYGSGKLLQAARPDRIDGTWDLVSRSGCAWRVGSGWPDGRQLDESRPVKLIPLTAALIAHDVFETIGLLDERFESYLEDMDLSLRAAAAGLLGRYCGLARAHHLGSATLGRRSTRMTRLLARNQVWLVAKHFPARWWWPIVIGQTLWGAVAIRYGGGSAFVHGKLAGLAQFRYFRSECHHEHREKVAIVVGECERELRSWQREPLADRFWQLLLRLS